jgi:hypothetical protein
MCQTTLLNKSGDAEPTDKREEMQLLRSSNLVEGQEAPDLVATVAEICVDR